MDLTGGLDRARGESGSAAAPRSRELARRWRRVAAAVRAASPVEHGRDLDALRRLEAIAGITRPIPLVSSNIAIEPGVFGIVTPVLRGRTASAEHLDEGQVEAILAHELCHVRRRDNLAAAAHMFVEAVFCFTRWCGG